jgi:Protein of Unknown function (DUF2784)
MGYRFAVTAILTVHFAFLAYVVGGGFLAIRWPRLFWPHLAAAAWGLLVILVPIVCPLTWAENWARQRAGEPALTKGFIDRYIEGVIYPARYTRLIDVLVALAVLGSWLLVYRHWRTRRGETSELSAPGRSSRSVFRP